VTLDGAPGGRVYEGVLPTRRNRAREAAFVAQTTRPLRVARMLALAYEFDALIAFGVVADRAELAGVLGFTRSRVTQFLDLTLLAPDIQEEILVTHVEAGRDAITEHALREIVRYLDWSRQRREWARLFGRSSPANRGGEPGPNRR